LDTDPGLGRRALISICCRNRKIAMLGKTFALGAGLAALCAATVMAQTEVATGPFTAAQVEEGRKVYFVHCAACHLPTMAGQGDALALAGYQFMAGWKSRTTQDLYNLIHSSMPQNAPNSLDDQSYANVTAYILHENGAKAGPTAFLAAPPLRIDLIANGNAPSDLGQPPEGAPAAPPPGGGRGAAATPAAAGR
jgi:mono/diheme cytochrome c family protein